MGDVGALGIEAGGEIVRVGYYVLSCVLWLGFGMGCRTFLKSFVVRRSRFVVFFLVSVNA